MTTNPNLILNPDAFFVIKDAKKDYVEVLVPTSNNDEMVWYGWVKTEKFIGFTLIKSKY